MSDSPAQSGFGINVGDAILTFLGDTTDLERAWTEMEENSTASATRTVNEVMRQYDRLGIEGSARLNQHAQQAQEAFEKIRNSGVASMTDLIQAEKAMLESQAALKTSLGEPIPVAIIERIESLKLQYIAITGTVLEFEAAQVKSAAVLEVATRATDQHTLALQREKAATVAEMEAMAELWAMQNKQSQGTTALGGIKVGKNAAGAGAEAEEGALAGGIAALGSTATTLAMYAGVAAVAGSLAEGVKQALAFNAAFTEVTTVITEDTPHAAEVIDMLRTQLLALPPTLGNITELTHGVYQALSAGIPAAEAVKVVAQSAILAKAALTDQETVVKLVTASMNAYGLTARDVDSITSALMATIQVGVLRGPQLADSLGRVLPVAANLKVSLSDVLGAATALTKGGLSADESMTALRQVLSAIEKPSSEAKKAMTEMGLSFADVRAEIVEKGLGAGLADLGSHIKDNTTLTTELFGNIRALTGILGLTGPQAKVYAEATAEISQAYKDANLAQIEFNKINQSLDGQLKVIGNTITNDFVAGFQKATPIIEALLPSLKAILVDSEAFKVVGFAILALLLTLSVTLSAAGVLIEGLRAGIIGLGLAFEHVRGFIHAYSGSAEEFNAHLASMKKSMEDADAASRANGTAMHDSLKAFDEIIRGSGEASDKSKEFAAAQLKLAEANDRLTEAQKKANDATSAAAREAADAADKHKLLEAAVKKTTEAMEKYANAHGISLVKELDDNVAAARRFTQEMISSHQPVATQVAAIINLNQALSKLRATLDDKRSIGQMLFDIGGGQGGITPIATTLTTNITDPVVDAFNAILEAEQKLGIKGTATLSKHFEDSKAAAQVMITQFLAGKVTITELRAAEDELAKSQKALNDSFQSDRQVAAAKALDAEKAAGVKGVQQLREEADKAKTAFDAMSASQLKGYESVKSVQQAELKSLEAEKALRLFLNQPVSDQLKKGIDDLKKSLGELNTGIVSMKDFGEDAFKSFSSSFGNAVSEVESGQKRLGAALEEALSSTLISISGQAASYALLYTGFGLAAAATGDEASASAYFAAAGEMALTAAVAGAIGAALSTGSSNQGGSGSPSIGSVSGTTQAAVAPTGAVNVQRFGSGGLVSGRTLAMIGDSKNDPSKNATEAVLPLDDPQAMAKLRAGLGGGSGLSVYVEGLISPDNLGKVMDQMSTKVKSGHPLVASHANKVLKKS